jgi:hypothetical protein
MKAKLMAAGMLLAGSMLAAPAFAVCDNCGTVTS